MADFGSDYGFVLKEGYRILKNPSLNFAIT